VEDYIWVFAEPDTVALEAGADIEPVPELVAVGICELEGGQHRLCEEQEAVFDVVYKQALRWQVEELAYCMLFLVEVYTGV